VVRRINRRRKNIKERRKRNKSLQMRKKMQMTNKMKIKLMAKKPTQKLRKVKR